MKIIRPILELWEHKNDIKSICNHITKCSNINHKIRFRNKEDNIKSLILSCIDKLDLKDNRLDVLEHVTIYLYLSDNHHYTTDNYYCKDAKTIANKYNDGYKSKVYIHHMLGGYYITTNLRVIVENNWFDDLKYSTSPSTYHKKRYTYNVVTKLENYYKVKGKHSNSEISISHYDNFKDSTNDNLTFVIPEWLDLEEGEVKDYGRSVITGKNQLHVNGKPCDIVDFDDNLTCEGEWLLSNNEVEQHYFRLLKKGWIPQQAKEVLPLSLKTQFVITMFEDDCRNFIALRSDGISGSPHPNIKVIADKIKELIEHIR